MGISTSRLCDRRAYRGRIDGEYRMRALGSFAVAHTRLANRDRADAGHDLAFRKMAVAHDALLARLRLEIGVLCEKLSDLRFDGLGQQRTRAAAQDLCEGIGKGPWLGELDHVTVRHGVSLLHWRSGALNTTTIRRLTRSRRHQLLAIAPLPRRRRRSVWHCLVLAGEFFLR